MRGKTTAAATALLLFLTFVFSGCSRFLPTDAPTDGSFTRLPIIMYHHITKNASRVNDYTVLYESFESDLKYIRDNGFTPVTVADLVNHSENGSPLPEKPIMITFDDGFESVYAYALPLLKEHGMRAVLSVVGEYTDRYTEHPDHSVQYSCCDWSEVDEMDKGGVIEIQNHTYNMHSLDKGRRGCSIKRGEDSESYVKALTEDLSLMQERLYEHLGHSADAIAYPFGSRCDLTDKTVKEMGFKAAFTCDQKVNLIDSGDDWLFRLGRFNRRGALSTAEFFSKFSKD